MRLIFLSLLVCQTSLAIALEMNTMKSKMEGLESDQIIKDQRITALDQKITALDQKISNMESNERALERLIMQGINYLETKITTLETEKEKMETKITTLETDKKKMETKITTLETDKKKMETKITTLETDKTSKDRKIRSLENDKSSKDRRLRKIEDKPYAFQCAYKHGWGAANTTIIWDKIWTSMSGVTGGFSLSTGQFTVGHSGVWEITFSMKARIDSGEEIRAYLYINGRQLTESEYYTYYTRSEGYVGSLGSRTLFMKLNKGDKVTLQAHQLSGVSYENTLCFHLAQPL